jgi:hypothetical protein
LIVGLARDLFRGVLGGGIGGLRSLIYGDEREGRDGLRKRGRDLAREFEDE